MDASELKKAVEIRHGGTAVLVEIQPVKEVIEGKTVWERVVHVFDLRGNAKSTRAYAWAEPTAGRTELRLCAVLHLGGVISPLDAVRAALTVDHKPRAGS
jgi:hypothetical protein